MIHDWYKIFNRLEFIATGLVSRRYDVNLEGVGLSEVIAYRGNLMSIQYNGVFLSYNLNSRNPFYFDDHAIYVDKDQYVHLGIRVIE